MAKGWSNEELLASVEAYRGMAEKEEAGVNFRSADQPSAGRFYVATHTSKRGLRFYTLWASFCL